MESVGTVSSLVADTEPRHGLYDTFRALRRSGGSALLLDGSGDFEDPWNCGPLIAVDARRIELEPDDFGSRILEVDGRVRCRRAQGDGPSETGVVVLMSYDAIGPARPFGLPRVVAFEVDRSVRFLSETSARVTLRGRDTETPSGTRRELARLTEKVTRANAPVADRPLTIRDRPTTSLPREAYLAAVQRVQRHIECGDVYQANLCQEFRGRCDGDAFELYLGLSRAAAAPRSAYVETDEFTLVSVSPEIFLRTDGDRVETHPIKGTRPRGATPDLDRSAGEELLASIKDRAELLMIVDLERNDLGRICRTASVETPQLAALRSFNTVHHLVARVQGRLKPDVDLERLLRATFPGGSITGAPKIRAMEILNEIEPRPRGYFTGSLFWFGDDGAMDSSILIRTLTVADGFFSLGAGGGIVSDSVPELEWEESNHKARALALALGFDPREAR